MTDLTGRIAVVTGGAGGIGAAIVKALKSAGARVAVLDLKTGGSGDLDLICDMASDPSVAAACAQVTTGLGVPDILVHCAATTFRGEVTATPIADFERVMNVNLYGAMRLTNGFIAAMRARGSGVLLFLSSINAGFATPGQGVYAASKAALDSLVKTLAVELAGDGIRVNSIRPSSVETPLLVAGFADAPDRDAAMAANIARHPLGRWGRVEDAANLALFLVSDEAGWITGAHYALDGGAGVTRR